ncbi:MAG TPA: carboxypeptidase-like regulatory domain-containing protein [Candidatus Solibacter sp.]|nr:carboxypeptidase-like regulatory domain-containing protein [Candidatus Solibacter sp.]
MKSLTLLLIAIPATAAITGTVINRSTGKPQPGATVAYYKVATASGPELVDQAKSDAQGNFTINQTPPPGPSLLRTAFDGVTYNHMLTPGSPTTGVTLDVFNTSKSPGEAKVSKHMILFEPGGGQVSVSETYLFTNTGKTAWNDPDLGTLKFAVPQGASQPRVQATAPGGMPLGAPVSRNPRTETYFVDFAVKPGDTRFDVTYTMPYTGGTEYSGRVLTKDENTYLIAPDGITMRGENLNDLGSEPRTKAHIYGLTGTSYKIQLTGSVAASAEEQPQAESDAGPKIEQTLPRVNRQAKLIVPLALGILALGFALLYRKGAAA